EHDDDIELTSSFTRIIDILRELAKQGRDIDPAQVRLLIQAQKESENFISSDPGNINIQVGSKSIYPKSRNQLTYIEAMFSKQLVFGIGPAGTGKTFLAIAKAVHDLSQNKRKKLILTRPVVEAGENLGFLPGDLTQKISPYLRPLYDALEAMIPMHTIRKMEENGVIEIAPLAYMRGRSLQNACIILDEAQNTTREQMKMFLTRIGENSEAVITGDITQIDLPSISKSGLVHASRILHSIDDIAFITFKSKDVIRSRMVRKIVDAYEKDF
ncbi:MAG: PhoH family protein, partial [Spirochaetales bacterium]|nr:PhoH family protein [Spirochaetales bacterium]